MNLLAWCCTVSAVLVSLNLQAASTVQLVDHDDSWRYHKGTNAPSQPDWKTIPDAELEPATWPTDNGGFGYAENGGITAETNNCETILNDMYKRYTTLYMRRQFNLAEAPAPEQRLYLRIDWDDGYIAWLDGNYLMQRNSSKGTNEPAYTDLAIGEHESSLGNEWANPAEIYDLGYATKWLGVGTHTLAIVGLNVSSTSSDFIQSADLYLDTPLPPATNLWALATSPLIINTNVVIPANETLVIEPGVTVQLGPGVRVIAFGQVIAAGTPEQRIRFTRSGASNWSGFTFSGSHSPTIFAYVDFEYANGAGNGNSAVMYIYDSQVTFDRDTFMNISGNKFMDIWFPQVIIRHSVFCDVDASSMFGVENMNPNGWFVVDGNLFGSDTGDSDIFHLNHVSIKNGPKALIMNNVFTGAGDDMLDDNETDTHIEGNLFMNFTTNHPLRSASAAVTTGDGRGIGNNLTTQHLTVVRNVFWGNDYGILNKDGGYVQVVNCVFVNNRGAILLDEPWRTSSGPGRACYIEGCIFWQNASENGQEQGTLAYLTNAAAFRTGAYYAGHTQVMVNNSLLPAQYHYLGIGNIDAEPMFVFPTNNLSLSPTNPAFAGGFDGFDANAFLLTNHLIPDVHLLPGSPAIGTGFNGADMGVYVPEGATISGEPGSPTMQTSAKLFVGGLDIWGYKYRLLGPGFTNDWSPEIQAMKYVSAITLTGFVATASCSNHGYVSGDAIEIVGADALCPYYNGRFTILNATSNTFDYAVDLGTNAAINEPIMTYAEKRTDIWCRKPQAVQLAGLTDGSYRLEAVRKNSMDVWQDENNPTTSQTWTVMTRPMEISSVAVDSTTVTLRFYAVAGQTYVIEYCDDLAQANWQTLRHLSALTANGEYTVMDEPVTVASRWYRLTVP